MLINQMSHTVRGFALSISTLGEPDWGTYSGEPDWHIAQNLPFGIKSGLDLFGLWRRLTKRGEVHEPKTKEDTGLDILKS